MRLALREWRRWSVGVAIAVGGPSDQCSGEVMDKPI
jgi:hypothetical protein